MPPLTLIPGNHMWYNSLGTSLVSVLKRSKYSHANESYEWDRTQEYLLVIPVFAYSCQFELDDARNKLVFH